MTQQSDFYELWQRREADVKNLTDEVNMYKSDCHDLRRMLADVREQLAAKDAQLTVAIEALKEIKDACCAHEQGFLDEISIDDFMDLTFDRATEALKQMGVD